MTVDGAWMKRIIAWGLGLGLIVAVGYGVWHERDRPEVPPSLRAGIAWVASMADRLLPVAATPKAAAPGRAAGGPAGAAGGGGKPALPVKVQAAQTGTVTETVEAVGSLRSDESVLIRTEVAGRIVGLHFVEGGKVARGALLVALDDSVPVAQLQQAHASLTYSQANYKRQAELAQSSVASVKVREEALARMRMDEAAVAVADAMLRKLKLYAPHDGVLGLRRVSVGDYLATGDAIINLERIDPVKVDFRVPELYAPAVREGQEIRIEVDALPGRGFTGTVLAVDPRIDEAGRNLSVRAVVANPDGDLRPGMFARVVLTLASRSAVVLVPEGAVVAGRTPTVYRIRDGRAVRTPVVIGVRRKGTVELRDGVAVGENVVIAGQVRLTDGAPVRIVVGGGGS